MRCDGEGNFEPLQCSRVADRRLIRCRCVDASGTTVPNTELEVADVRDAPNCVDMGNDILASGSGFFHSLLSSS